MYIYLYIYISLKKNVHNVLRTFFLETSQNGKRSKNVDHRPKKTLKKRRIYVFHNKWHSWTKTQKKRQKNVTSA